MHVCAYASMQACTYMLCAHAACWMWAHACVHVCTCVCVCVCMCMCVWWVGTWVGGWVVGACIACAGEPGLGNPQCDDGRGMGCGVAGDVRLIALPRWRLQGIMLGDLELVVRPAHRLRRQEGHLCMDATDDGQVDSHGETLREAHAQEFSSPGVAVLGRSALPHERSSTGSHDGLWGTDSQVWATWVPQVSKTWGCQAEFDQPRVPRLQILPGRCQKVWDAKKKLGAGVCDEACPPLPRLECEALAEFGIKHSNGVVGNVQGGWCWVCGGHSIAEAAKQKRNERLRWAAQLEQANGSSASGLDPRRGTAGNPC
eukprot:EG_transcript_15533